MNNYFDRWGRLHHKPCIDKYPSSNNGWIYSAYANKMGIALDINNLYTCFIACLKDGKFYRHPMIIESKVPMSRDEILGAASLKLLKPSNLKNWNFSPFDIPTFNPIKLVKQLIELRGKHRNYFWQNNLDQIYRFAFSVPFQDRAFILECWGENKSLRYLIYKAIAFIDSKTSTPKNGIAWLKYSGENRKKIMQKEFPEDHPLQN